MRIWRLTLTAALLLATTAARGGAQSRPTLGSLASGDTIKVWSVAPRLNGEAALFNALRADTLHVGPTPLAATPALRASIPFTSLRRVDVRRGTHRSTTRIVVGILAGAAVGGLIGGAVGPAIECRDGCPGDLGGIAGFVLGAGTGIIVGGTTGGIIGARRTARWVPVTLQR